MEDFKPNTKIQLQNGDSVTVCSKIGEGGQGAVYKVNYNGKEYALKWYLPNYLKRTNCKKFCKNLSANVKAGSPSKYFLWPKAIAMTGKKSAGVGYIMDLRPSNYAEFTKFIKAKERFASTTAVLNAAVNIVNAFQALHAKGLSYQDLSPGNFFIDKNNGDVLVCDNDNVAPYGENLGVGGTPGYMAPEVILGKSKPDTNTDLFSLAVILFELFFLAHPLEGANCCKYPCLTPKIEKELYAENPVFVCSKTDKSNVPVRGTCSNLMKLWPVYPEFLHEAFERAFGEGLKNQNKRLSENDWKRVLYKLKDNTVTCPKCHEILFADKSSGGAVTCDVCGKKFSVPYKLCVNGFEIFADKDKEITEYHTEHSSTPKAVGIIVESKKNPGVFGLRNVSDKVWQVAYPNKPITTYDKDKVITLIPDTEIEIGAQKILVKGA